MRCQRRVPGGRTSAARSPCVPRYSHCALVNAVQWYDFALYGAFATVIGAVFFPAQDPSVVMLAAFATYGIAVIIRPVGALIFGRMADIRGRRAVLLPIILLMAGATAAVGFLPGYATIGILAPIALIVLRAGRAWQLVESWVWQRYSSSNERPAISAASWLPGTPPPWLSGLARAWQ
jgi:MFS family permease